MINSTKQKEKRFKIGIISVSLLLLFISLTQNAFYVGSVNAPEEVASMYAYLCGWIVLIGSGISWLANVLLYLSWILLFRKSKYSLHVSISAVVLSLSFLLNKSVVTNAGGISRGIVSYDIGYWLWLSSCVVSFLGIYIHKKQYNS